MSRKVFRLAALQIAPYAVMAAIKEANRVANEMGLTVSAAPNCAIFLTYEGTNTSESVNAHLNVQLVGDANLELRNDDEFSEAELARTWPDLWGEW